MRCGVLMNYQIIIDYSTKGSKMHHPSKQLYTKYSLNSTTPTTFGCIDNVFKYPPSTTPPPSSRSVLQTLDLFAFAWQTIQLVRHLINIHIQRTLKT